MKPKGAKTDPIIRKAKAKKVVSSLKKNDMDITAAAKDLGVTVQAIHKQIDTNPHVRSGLQSMLDELKEAGATDKKAARVISEAMDADKTVSIEDLTSDDEDGEEVHGRRVIKIKEADHALRLKATEQYAKIKRLIGDDDGRADPPADKKEVHLHFHNMDKRQILEFINGKLQK